MIKKLYYWALRFGRDSKKIIALFFIVKICLLCFISFGKNIIPFSTYDYTYNGDHYYHTGQTTIENSLAPYDGQLYLKIADRGYRGVVQEDPTKKIYAFFPLYPLLIFLTAHLIGNNVFLAGIFVSFLASFLGVIFFYKLCRLDESEKVSIKTIFYFLIFPASIFFIAIYTESLFFFLSVMTFYFARKRSWWIAGMMGFFTSLTRSPGVLLFVPLCVEYIKELKIHDWSTLLQKTKANFFALCLIPFGLMVFLFYSYGTVGDFFFPLHIQELWGRGTPNLLNIISTLYTNIMHINILPMHGFKSSQLDTLFTVIFISLLCFQWKKIRLSYRIYALIVILFPLSSGSTMSMFRYIAVSFPHFILLGKMATHHKYLNVFLTGTSLILLGGMSLRFINWYWVG